ncbi:MAG TPA: hypothetical protein DC038_13040 [Clostridiales bacterium]|nr:hypothetical protein [Clostridiales bacterium]
MKNTLKGRASKIILAALMAAGTLGFTGINAEAMSSMPSTGSRPAMSMPPSSAVQGEDVDYIVSEDADTITVRDKRNKEVTIKKHPKRVICAYNSYLDLWYKAGGEVIGKVDDAAEKPVPGAENAESVGSVNQLSIEKMMSLEPDLVILSPAFKGHLEIGEQLEENGIDVLLLDSNNFREYTELAEVYTKINGRDDLYKTLVEDVVKEREDIISKVPSDVKPKAAIFFASIKDLKLRTSGHGVGEMLKDLGTVNIADGTGDGDLIPFSLEKIIEEDPDFIFVQTMGSDSEAIKETLKREAEEKESFASLTAVKEGRYIVLPKDLYLYKPNYRYAEAYMGLAEILYPEVFRK